MDIAPIVLLRSRLRENRPYEATPSKKKPRMTNKSEETL
nr:MAG TPA: hypothetical protein [Caudoviricetes sp.]